MKKISSVVHNTQRKWASSWKSRKKWEGLDYEHLHVHSVMWTLTCWLYIYVYMFNVPIRFFGYVWVGAVFGFGLRLHQTLSTIQPLPRTPDQKRKSKHLRSQLPVKYAGAEKLLSRTTPHRRFLSSQRPGSTIISLIPLGLCFLGCLFPTQLLP